MRLGCHLVEEALPQAHFSVGPGGAGMCRQSPASGCPGNIPKTTRLLGGCNWVPGVHAELRVRARGPVCLQEGLVADRTSLGPQGQGRRGPGCCPARGCARLHGAPENGREGRGVGRLCRLQLEESPPSPARARRSRKPPLAAESRRKKPGFPLSDSSPASKKPVEGGRGEAAVASAGRPAHVRKSRTSRG